MFQTGNIFRHDDWIPINGPLSQDGDTVVRSIAFSANPELAELQTSSGAGAFLHVVGLSEDEGRAAKQWQTARLLALLPGDRCW